MILLTEIIDITCKKISQHLHVRDDLEIMLINNKRYLLRFDSGFDHTTTANDKRTLHLQLLQD